MIPVYRCRKMEPAVTLLAKHFRHVIVDATWWLFVAKRYRIRFDLVRRQGVRVYWDKTDSQIKAWREEGGILYNLHRKNFDEVTYGPHDARFFVITPRKVEFLDRSCEETRGIAVAYQPPTWELYHSYLYNRSERRSEKLMQREYDALSRLIKLVDSAPEITSSSLRLLFQKKYPQAQLPLSLSSSEFADELPADVVHEFRKDHGVP